MPLGADFLRRSRWIAGGFVGIFVALHLGNAVRLDAPGLFRGAQALLARAEDLSRRAMPEYQDLVLARLPSNPNNGPFYRFDDNLHAAKLIPRTFTTPPTEGDEFELGLEFEGDQEPRLVSANGSTIVEPRDGLLVVVHRDGDYLITDELLQIPLVNISDFVLRARADRGTRFEISWAAEGRESELGEGTHRLSLDLIADGEFHTYVVNARNAFQHGVDDDENISRIGIAPSNVDGATVEIDFVRIVSKQWKYAIVQTGTSYETIDGELRPVIYMAPDRTLEYSVDVPEDDPELSFGTGTLLDDPGLELTVSIDAATVFSTTAAHAREWRDHRIDLTRWAGQTVRVAFEVQGSGTNVAFWSNPILRSAVRNPFNVIMVLEDTLRADHLSTHGYPRDTSPWRTRFMGEFGTVFLNAHSQATKTRPSIPALMTGLYPTATGVWDFTDSLSDRYLTLQEILRAQGFVTGSFIQNGNAGPYAGLHQGFSSLRDSETIGSTTEEGFGTRVLEWLDTNGDQNFFLYLHVIDPHGKYDPPAPYDRWYREAPPDTRIGERPLHKSASIDPPWAETPSPEARRLLYDGEILHNDHVLGGFIEELRQRGLLENTLLVFVSDHGEWLGERGMWEHVPPGLRPVIHVPLMMSYPMRFPTPRRIEESVQLIDVMPTILEIASVDDSDLLMLGDSLVSLINGDESDKWRTRVTVSEEPTLMERTDPCACGSLFFGDWQLHGSRMGRPGRIQSPFIKTGVYRFKHDGIYPVVSFLPDLFARYLREITLSRLAAANTVVWQKLTEGQEQDVYTMDPATLEKLRGLGYVN